MADTYSHAQIDVIAKYVMNQERYHKKTSFREEYMELLQEFHIAYKNEYIFIFFDETDISD